MVSLCRSSILILALFNLLAAYLPADLKFLIFSVAIIVMLTGLPLMGAGFRLVAIVFGITGALILAYTSQPLAVWVAAVNSMTNVISILTIMSLFAIPMEAGRYDQAVRYWVNQAVKSEKAIFLLTMLITHFFASFMLFGTIPVVMALLGGVLKQSVSNYERFMATAASRGYSLVTLWAPGAINLFLVIQATGVKWLDIFVPGVVLGSIGLGLSYLWEVRSFSSVMTAVPEQKKSLSSELSEHTALRKGMTIILAVSGLIALAVVLEYYNVGTSSSQRVMTAGTIVICCWMAVILGEATIRASIGNYWRNGIVKTIDLAPLFLAMGVFSKAVENSGLLVVAQSQIQGVASALGLGAVIVLPLFLIVAAVIGIHPFISIVLVGQVVMALHLPVTSLTIALSLALGGSISYMVSPFAGMILTLARYLDAKTSDVALRWNWQFCTLLYLVGIVFVVVWGQYFG